MLLALLLAVPLRANAASDLYAAANPVPDQSAAARAAAFTQDLATVFVKVSGDPAAAGLAAQADAAKLVLEYRYRQKSGAAPNGIELWARFDRQAVNTALTAAGEPIWGANRPNVVAWVLAPAGVVSDDATTPVAEALGETAAQRGLPLVLPLNDLTDQKQVSAFDIRSFYLPALTQASRRYGAQALLVGSIGAGAGATSSEWRLVFDGKASPLPVSASTPASAAAAAVGQAATLLARRFAFRPGSSLAHALVVAVTGVNDLKGEVAVRRALAGVQGMEHLQLLRVAGGELHFQASYDGSAGDLARVLALSGMLVRTERAVPAPFAMSAAQPALTFRYTP